MSIGLPKLEISFKAAAQAVANRSKQGIVGVIVRDTKAQGIHSLGRVSEIPQELGTKNMDYVTRAFEGTDMGTPSKVILCVVAADMVEGLTQISPYPMDYMAGPPDVTAEECEVIAAWAQGLRADYGTVKPVLPHTAADDKGIIAFDTDDITVGSATYTAAEYCSRIAGVLAGLPATCSGTYAVLPEVTGVPPLSKVEQTAAIDAGKLILIHDGISGKIARAVNSLLHVPAEGKQSWKKIKIVETMDLLTYFLRTTSENEYRGKYTNSYDNKMLYVSAVLGYLHELENQGIINKGKSAFGIDVDAQTRYLKSVGVEVSSMTEQAIKEYNTGSWIFTCGTCDILDTMEDFAIGMQT